MDTQKCLPPFLLYCLCVAHLCGCCCSFNCCFELCFGFCFFNVGFGFHVAVFFLWCALIGTLWLSIFVSFCFSICCVYLVSIFFLFVFLAFCCIWFELFINYFLTSQTQRVFCPPSGRMCPPLTWEGLNILDEP